MIAVGPYEMEDTKQPTVFVFTAGCPHEGLTLQGVYTDPVKALADVREYAKQSEFDEILLEGYTPGDDGEMEDCGELASGTGRRGLEITV